MRLGKERATSFVLGGRSDRPTQAQIAALHATLPLHDFGEYELGKLLAPVGTNNKVLQGPYGSFGREAIYRSLPAGTVIDEEFISRCIN